MLDGRGECRPANRTAVAQTQVHAVAGSIGLDAVRPGHVDLLTVGRHRDLCARAGTTALPGFGSEWIVVGAEKGLSAVGRRPHADHVGVLCLGRCGVRPAFSPHDVDLPGGVRRHVGMEIDVRRAGGRYHLRREVDAAVRRPDQLHGCVADRRGLTRIAEHMRDVDVADAAHRERVAPRCCPVAICVADHVRPPSVGTREPVIPDFRAVGVGR